MALGKEPREEPTRRYDCRYFTDISRYCIRICRIKYVTTHLLFSVAANSHYLLQKNQIREINQLKAHILYLHTKKSSGLTIL